MFISHKLNGSPSYLRQPVMSMELLPGFLFSIKVYLVGGDWNLAFIFHNICD
jgi:hypothetical protein